MKKSALLLFILLIVAIFLSSCTASFPSKDNIAMLTGEKATELLKDKTEKEIHDNWGEPDDSLSGFYGDVYLYNGKSIVIYFDNNSKVTNVLVFDKQN